ncbi:MAG: T9SS type A sorting domain-containing protein [Chitinophagaceae bacterium]
MKKLLLVGALAAVSAVGAQAQSLVKAGLKSHVNAGLVSEKAAVAPTSGKSTAKTTLGGSREYSHFDYNLSVSSFESDSIWACRIWFDSTVQQTYGTGLGNVNYNSVAQVLYPMDGVFNDATNPNYKDQVGITSTNAYTVDSVRISGLYVTGLTRPSTIVDTLIISVAYQTAYSHYRFDAAYLAGFGIDVTPYLTTADLDTFHIAQPINKDSVNRAAYSFTTGSGTPTRVLWKEPLTSGMRSPIATADIQTFTFAVPGKLSVPAGSGVVMTYTFKSGDTWVPNTSHIDTFHRFMAIFGGSRKIMPYAGKWNATLTDRSHSALMFSSDTTYYWGSAFIEAMNSVSFFYEYLATSAVVTCADCKLVKDLGSNINEQSIVTEAKAFPVPANNSLTVPFTVAEKANVSVNISNMLGQVVATQNAGTFNAGQKGNVTFNTSALANGVYIYTVEANGQKVSERFSVAH